jgi:hypothetical protein
MGGRKFHNQPARSGSDLPSYPVCFACYTNKHAGCSRDETCQCANPLHRSSRQKRASIEQRSRRSGQSWPS